GPVIDQWAQKGNPEKFVFSQATISDYNYSFSGLKTSFLYFLRDRLKENANFIKENTADLCASFQKAICDSLIKKLIKAANDYNISQIAIAGGVSANFGLQNLLKKTAQERNWEIYIPPIQLTTDNAAMISIVGYYKFQKGNFSDLNAVPYTKSKFNL
ncbi:MAG: carbamoyltransferase N-terminal domain-containing protein, partial [Bacteroidales bacterium]|nr:carbamoyltransferase N-terminal domain-containing protein [Bacteroidales bacterium]